MTESKHLNPRKSKLSADIGERYCNVQQSPLSLCALGIQTN